MQTLQSSTTDPVISTLITREMSTDFDEKPCRKAFGGVPYLINLLPLQKEVREITEFPKFASFF